MTSRRTDTGGLIHRDHALSFTFDGKPYRGAQGDTVASALLANDVRVVGRSFKYHRARGVWGAWFDDPNAVFDIRLNGYQIPNCPGTTTQLVEGMQVRAVNAWPNARLDVKQGLDLLHNWLPAGFYYKTFMSPNWHLFEPSIRKMAGLGSVDSTIAQPMADQVHEHCDMLVVGAGAAGLTAARAASEAGQHVIVVDDHPVAGGGVYQRGLTINGQQPSEWVDAQVAALNAAGAQLLTSTTAFGAYDHGLIGLVQDCGFASPPRLWRVRAKRTVLAAGATDRPLTFENNDLPGILSVQAGAEFLKRYGVLVGRQIAVASNNNGAEPVMDLLRKAGATVKIIDLGSGPLRATGRAGIRSIHQGSNRFDCDALLASSGLTPLVHLWRHAGGKLNWSDDLCAFVPGGAPEQMSAIGAANGTFDFEHALDEARAAGLEQPTSRMTSSYQITAHWPQPGSGGRQWIDYQNDVTLKDIELAAQENYVSVEHLKRYTTLGMATDQGKTSNMPGLAAMAAIQNKSIPEVGTTTFRPPFVPVPFEAYRGHQRGQLVAPLKRLALETTHRAAGAALGEYGGWLRPGWYGHKPIAQAINDEIQMSRTTVGILDASPLGKIDVMGPDAEQFVHFVYYNTINTMKPGHIRYGFMLTEGGIVYDDGVITRLDENRFVISCSSSHVEGVLMHLEGFRQDGNDPDKIFVHDTTAHWSTVTLTGPKAREALKALNLSVDLSAQALPHMRLIEATWNNNPIRIARVSFTGDLSFEISIASSQVARLWDVLAVSAAALGGGPIGLEASSVMRAEKGFLIIGKDTDGKTMPHDLGFSVPRQKKQAAFIGDRSLHTANANDTMRAQLVGLTVPDAQPMLPTGAHIISDDTAPRSLGVVTSSYDSPTLGRPIAMAMLEDGFSQMGQTVRVRHFDQIFSAQVTPACALDPNGDRLNA